MTGLMPYENEANYQYKGSISANKLKTANAFRDRQLKQGGAMTLEVYLAK